MTDDEIIGALRMFNWARRATGEDMTPGVTDLAADRMQTMHAALLSILELEPDGIDTTGAMARRIARQALGDD